MSDITPQTKSVFHQKATVLLLSGILLTALVAFYIVSSRKPENSGITTLPGVKFRWATGDLTAYAFDQTVHISLNLDLHDRTQVVNAPEPYKTKSQAETLQLKAILFVRVDKATSDRITLRMGFIDPVAHASMGRNTLLESIYSEPFLAEYSPDGAFLQSTLSNKIAAEDEERITGILQALQVTLPDQQLQNHWTVKEKDSLGVHVSRYTVHPRHQIEREQLEYLEAAPFQSYYDALKILRSKLMFRPSDSTSWYESLRLNQTVKLLLGKEEQGEVHNDISLRLLPEEKRGPIPEWMSLSNEDFKILLLSTPKQENSPLAIKYDDEKRKALLASGQSVSSFSKALAGELSPAEILSRTAELREYLRLFPEKTDEVLALLLKAPYTEDAGAHLIYALQGAGTKESEQALVELIESAGFSDINRRRAVAAIGQMVASSSTVNALWELTQKSELPIDERLATMSILALGSISGHLQEENEISRSDEIFSQLKSRLEEASTKNNYREVANYILALGNTFRADAAPQIIPSLTSADSDEVRRAAASALESVDTPDATEALVTHLLDEDAPEVRKKIVTSLLHHEMTDEAITSVLQAALEEDDSATRRVMALYLEKGVGTHPEIKEALPQLLELETDPGIYKILATALNK